MLIHAIKWDTSEAQLQFVQGDKKFAVLADWIGLLFVKSPWIQGNAGKSRDFSLSPAQEAKIAIENSWSQPSTVHVIVSEISLKGSKFLLLHATSLNETKRETDRSGRFLHFSFTENQQNINKNNGQVKTLANCLAVKCSSI